MIHMMTTPRNTMNHVNHSDSAQSTQLESFFGKHQSESRLFAHQIAMKEAAMARVSSSVIHTPDGLRLVNPARSMAESAVLGEFVDARKLPVDYDASLLGCTFAKDYFQSPPTHHKGVKEARALEHVLDANGVPIGVGRNKEQACWLAAKVCRSRIQQPVNYHPSLKDCVFGVDAHMGVAMQTVLAPDEKNPGSFRVVSSGPDKETAAQKARITLLREKPVNELTNTEFSSLCVIATVAIVKPKMKNGTEPKFGVLAPEQRSLHNGFIDLRLAIRSEAEKLGIGVHDQVAWCDERMNEILKTPMKNGGFSYLSMKDGQHLILRTHDSQPGSVCAAEVLSNIRTNGRYIDRDLQRDGAQNIAQGAQGDSQECEDYSQERCRA
jgi:hypothetical protein